MKDLWDKTFELFRRHLILWVPCSIAGILMLGLGKLEKAEAHWLLKIFARQHSVLGGEVPSPDLAQAQHRAMMLIPPLGSLNYFLKVCFFVVALAATANLVRMILDEQRPDIIAAVQGILPRSREILLLTLKYMVVLGVCGGVLIVVGSSPLISERAHELVLSKVSLFVIGLVAQACLGWLLVPSAIRLLRPPGSRIVSIKDRRWGTIFAVVTSASALALEYFVGKAETGLIFDKPWEGAAFVVANTVIINAPEVLLFIALTLLSLKASGEKTPLAAEPAIA